VDISQYPDIIREKIGRISDILVQMNMLPLLRENLCFQGGTALNFLHMNAPRLSEDLDFNYRHMDERDWGEVRNDIDKEIKRVLYDLGYNKDAIKIQPTYNLCRFHIEYLNSKGLRDSVKIETGYMRRIPILKDDILKEFIHPMTEQRIYIKTSEKEGLFANKFCTMFSRASVSPRDIYDVYSISSVDFDMSLFIDVVLIESIFMNIDIIKFPLETLFEENRAAQVQDLVVGDVHWENISEKVRSFIERTNDELKKRKYSGFISGFHDNNKIDLDKLYNKDKINERLENHPILLWLIEEGN
jgi:predicted nucleotidyltransferase component of viral defense system